MPPYFTFQVTRDIYTQLSIYNFHL